MMYTNYRMTERHLGVWITLQYSIKVASSQVFINAGASMFALCWRLVRLQLLIFHNILAY